MGQSIAILLDTKGPEIRTGLFEEDEVELEKGSTVTLTMEEFKGNKDRFTISYKGLIDDIEVGKTSYLMMDLLH